jgi:starch synthase
VDQPEFYQRSGLYQEHGLDYADNAERFLFLSKAIAHLALHLPARPELVHLNDWQTAFAALFLHHHRRMAGQGSCPQVCMTVHNLAYQGLFPTAQYALTNLPWEYYSFEGVEFYGQVSSLKAGMAFADLLTTVSPRYAREITTSELGCGLDGLLRQRQAKLHGILNGVDYEEWDPTKDPYVKHTFTSIDLTGKAANKSELQRELQLKVDPTVPLFANIGRLVEQKGIDILLAALEEMLPGGIQFVQLGAGESRFESAFQELARRFPGNTALRIGFDEALSHRIEAGCDFFIMPSRFEPCGLNQMYSLRYGTVPIVRATGGLDDTIIDIRQDQERANGIKFEEYSSRALVKAIRKALALYTEPELLEHYRQNGMNGDFSWDRTTGHYLELFQQTLHSG